MLLLSVAGVSLKERVPLTLAKPPSFMVALRVGLKQNLFKLFLNPIFFASLDNAFDDACANARRVLALAV